VVKLEIARVLDLACDGEVDRVFQQLRLMPASAGILRCQSAPGNISACAVNGNVTSTPIRIVRNRMCIAPSCHEMAERLHSVAPPELVERSLLCGRQLHRVSRRAHMRTLVTQMAH
jgi:hypothetical protein